MRHELRYTAAQIRAELAGLEQLRTLGPCDLPEPDAMSWCDPAWLTAWLRNHPEEIDRQSTALTAELEAMNLRTTKGTR